MILGRNIWSLVLLDVVKVGDFLFVFKVIIMIYVVDVGNVILFCVDNSNEDYILFFIYIVINCVVYCYIDDLFMC